MSTRIPYIVNPDGTPGSRWEPRGGCEGCDVVQCWSAANAWRMAHHPNPLIANRFTGLVEKTPDGRISWTGILLWYPEKLQEPLRKRKPTTYGVCFGGDLFAGEGDYHLHKVFYVMAQAPQHTFLVLTKRAERLRDFISRWRPWFRSEPVDTYLSNIWFGVSVTGPADAYRIDTLQETPALTHRWVSWEPCVERIDFGQRLTGIEWLVMGCESGPGRRLPKCEECGGAKPDYSTGFALQGLCQNCSGTGYAAWGWAREALGACDKAGSAFYLKQLPDARGRVIAKPVLDGHQHLDLPWSTKGACA